MAVHRKTEFQVVPIDHLIAFLGVALTDMDENNQKLERYG